MDTHLLVKMHKPKVCLPNYFLLFYSTKSRIVGQSERTDHCEAADSEIKKIKKPNTKPKECYSGVSVTRECLFSINQKALLFLHKPSSL